MFGRDTSEGKIGRFGQTFLPFAAEVGKYKPILAKAQKRRREDVTSGEGVSLSLPRRLNETPVRLRVLASLAAVTKKRHGTASLTPLARVQWAG